MTITDEFCQGFAARLLFSRVNHNPHPKNSYEYRKWEDGWNAAAPRHEDERIRELSVWVK